MLGWSSELHRPRQSYGTAPGPGNRKRRTGWGARRRGQLRRQRRGRCIDQNGHAPQLAEERGESGKVRGVAEVSYVSRVRIERLGGPQRLAYLPAEREPVVFGVHSEVAEHYGVSPEDYPPHATTLDYVVAAAGG